MSKLTKKFIDSLTAPSSGYIIEWDDELKGFGVRIMESGTFTYVVNYRTNTGRQRRISIGRHGTITPAEARKKAIQILGEVTNNADPLEERELARKEITFKVLAEEYIQRHASQKRSGQEDIRIIKKDLLNPWGHRHTKDISRSDIIRLLYKIKDRGAPIAANRTLALVRKMFNFGIEQAMIESNPCTRIKPPSKERHRDRVLSEQEIRSFWDNINATDASPAIQTALQLILVTAQRPGEVLGISMSEIDMNSGWWTIPAEKSKNGLAHRVPLSPLALELIGNADSGNGLLFPSPKNPQIPINVNALSHATRRNMKVFGIDHFTPHDLRRTAASSMASMGISRIVISKILNHAETGITAVYDRHGYDPEKRNSLNAWAIKLSNILSGKSGEVIPLAHREL